MENFARHRSDERIGGLIEGGFLSKYFIKFVSEDLMSQATATDIRYLV